MSPATLALALNYGTGLFALAFPAWRFKTHRSYPRMILQTWLLMFIWAILNSILFPVIFHILDFYPEGPMRYFPEGPAVVAVGVMGWVYGLVVAGVVFVCRLVWFRLLRPLMSNRVE